jgi:hypothetical protein
MCHELNKVGHESDRTVPPCHELHVHANIVYAKRSDAAELWSLKVLSEFLHRRPATRVAHREHRCASGCIQRTIEISFKAVLTANEHCAFSGHNQVG